MTFFLTLQLSTTAMSFKLILYILYIQSKRQPVYHIQIEYFTTNTEQNQVIFPQFFFSILYRPASAHPILPSSKLSPPPHPPGHHQVGLVVRGGDGQAGQPAHHRRQLARQVAQVVRQELSLDRPGVSVRERERAALMSKMWYYVSFCCCCLHLLVRAWRIEHNNNVAFLLFLLLFLLVASHEMVTGRQGDVHSWQSTVGTAAQATDELI